MLSILRMVQGPAQAQPHCLSSRLFEEDGSDGAIMYMEHWDSEYELDRHIRSDLYSRILDAVELSRLAPELNFFFVKETRGMDLIEASRAKPSTE